MSVGSDWLLDWLVVALVANVMIGIGNYATKSYGWALLQTILASFLAVALIGRLR